MIQNNYGEMIFNQADVCDLLMRGHDAESLKNMLVDESVNLENAVQILDSFPSWLTHTFNVMGESIVDWDHAQQSKWHMPQEYKDLDIAEYVLSLCETDAELQRVGQELLLYQERDLFNLLRYLKYLVDVMTENKVIWGVGRGSSTASYILYKLKVHRINSMYYNLDIAEFLR